jgi:hypothetical protein
VVDFVNVPHHTLETFKTGLFAHTLYVPNPFLTAIEYGPGVAPSDRFARKFYRLIFPSFASFGSEAEPELCNKIILWFRQ